MSFPAAYPLSPPSIVFAADVFHPLLTPLTTITYTTGLSERESAQAAGQERLPPGSFGLRHGFPEWYDAPADNGDDGAPPSEPSPRRRSIADIHVVDILRYVRSCFENDKVLDSVPFETAGNPGAWYAWRAHRADAAKDAASKSAAAPGEATPQSTPRKETPKSPAHTRASSNPQNRPRRPSEWNWEGVWEERVKKAVRASLTEPSLFASNASQPDEIHFQNVRDEDLDDIHSDMRSHLNT